MGALAGNDALAMGRPKKVSVDWDAKPVHELVTVPTLQVVTNPLLRRKSPIHDRVYQAIRDLGAEYVRYVPWYPYPKLAVAELDPPADGKTSWDFSEVDPLTTDFLDAQEGREVVMNFSTIPEWMFKTPKPVRYPDDPDALMVDYQQGTELRDPTKRELGDYYERLMRWYTQGGFNDEYGKWHESGHHYSINTWEVGNEIDAEHWGGDEEYIQRYDAMVKSIQKVNPKMKFVGPSLSMPLKHLSLLRKFLDHRNHAKGVPLDYISYHFYGMMKNLKDPKADARYAFLCADWFFVTIKAVDAIRLSLSPKTGTMINELGTMVENDPLGLREIPDYYWNISAAVYAYMFARLAAIGVENAASSQMVGFPSQWPSVSMVDWNTGAPNARYWAVKMMIDHFGHGGTVVRTKIGGSGVFAQAFKSVSGRKELLLVNRENKEATVELERAPESAQVELIDLAGGPLAPPRKGRLAGQKLVLKPFAVAVVAY